MTNTIYAATLDQIPGQVISIPLAGTNVPWLVSGYIEGGYVEVMAMTNVCSISRVGCTTSAGGSSTSGTVWNATSSTNNCTIGNASGYCNQLASLKTRNYLIQMDNIGINCAMMGT